MRFEHLKYKKAAKGQVSKGAKKPRSKNTGKDVSRPSDGDKKKDGSGSGNAGER